MKKVAGIWIPEEGKKPSKSLIYAMFMPKKGGCGWDYNCRGAEVFEVVSAKIEELGLDEVEVSRINEDIRQHSEAKQTMRDRLNAMLAEAGFERKAPTPAPAPAPKPAPKKAQAKPADDLAARIAAAEELLAELKAMAGL